MRTVPDRKIMRSLCKSYKTNEGRPYWSKIARELLKLNFFQAKIEKIQKEREAR